MKRGFTDKETALLVAMQRIDEWCSLKELAGLSGQPLPSVQYRVKHFLTTGLAEIKKTQPHRFRLTKKGRAIDAAA